MGLDQLPRKSTRNVGEVPFYDREEKVRRFDQSQEQLRNIGEDEAVAEKIRQDMAAKKLAE